MDSSQIDLPGTQVSTIESQHGTLRIAFSRALIIKSMTGSKELTRWWQAGTLVMDGMEDLPTIPTGPLVCSGGDIDDNLYTYRDMIPIPFESRGKLRFLLRFEGVDQPLIAQGTAARLELVDTPRYLEHIRV